MSRGKQGKRSAAVAAVACAAGMPFAAAQSIPVPLAPDNPTVADQWVNSQIRLGEGTQGLSISLIDAPATTPSNDTIRATVRVHNDGAEPADGLMLTPRRGPVSGSLTDARAATVAQVGEYTVAGAQVTVPTVPPDGHVDVEELGVIDYWFVSDGVRIHKTVHHNLLRYVDGVLNNDDPEVTEVAWVPISELIEHLAYADERKLARIAIDRMPDLARAERDAGRVTPR